jgi:hypothetical protein
MLKRIVSAVLLSLLVGVSLMAQGASPVKVTGISVSPSTFKAGDVVTVTVTLANGSTSSYGCAGLQVQVYLYKASPYTVTNQIWHASQPVASPMAGGETRAVTLSAKWTVPNIDTPTFHIMAWGPVCAPHEFGQNAVLKVDKTCVYVYRRTIDFTPRAPIPRLPRTP